MIVRLSPITTLAGPRQTTLRILSDTGNQDVTLNAWAVVTSGGTVNGALNPNSPSGQISATDVAIPVGATHTYTVTITFTTSAAATNLTCTGEPRNGAFNTASITGSASASASGCGPVPAALNLTLGKTASVAQAHGQQQRPGGDHQPDHGGGRHPGGH